MIEIGVGADFSGATPSIEEEIARVRRLSSELRGSIEALAERIPPSDEPSDVAWRVRSVIRARRKREEIFPSEWFADPAWDILLNLFLAAVENKQSSVSSICINAAVPPTTALRWVGRLVEDGAILRTADPADPRRAYLHLSPAIYQLMLDYFKSDEILRG